LEKSITSIRKVPIKTWERDRSWQFFFTAVSAYRTAKELFRGILGESRGLWIKKKEKKKRI